MAVPGHLDIALMSALGDALQWLERTRRAKPIPMKQSAAQVIREMRDLR